MYYTKNGRIDQSLFGLRSFDGPETSMGNVQRIEWYKSFLFWICIRAMSNVVRFKSLLSEKQLTKYFTTLELF